MLTRKRGSGAPGSTTKRYGTQSREGVKKSKGKEVVEGRGEVPQAEGGR